MRRQRLEVLIWCTLFTVVFHATYVFQLATVWGYWGFSYSVYSVGALLFGWALSILPGVWLRGNVERPSHLIAWLMYMTVYVPSILVPLYIRGTVDSHTGALLCNVAGAFLLMHLVAQLPPVAVKKTNRGGFFAWILVGALTAGLMIYVFATFGGSIRFVGFADLYDLRSENNQPGFINYAENWLSAILFPLLISYGLCGRKLWLTVLGTAGEVVLYAVVAMKSVLLSLPLYFAMYFLLGKTGHRTGVKIVAIGTALLAISCLTPLLEGPLPLMAGAVIGMRTFGTPGLCTYQYDLFFTEEPWTFFSQIRGLDVFTSYPYELPVYRLIGQRFYASEDLVANAHPFAQDGLSSLGVYGIVPMGLLVGCLSWLFNSVGKRHHSRFSSLAVLYTTMNIANSSLFTNVLSGGTWLLVFLLPFLPQVGACGRVAGTRTATPIAD